MKNPKLLVSLRKFCVEGCGWEELQEFFMPRQFAQADLDRVIAEYWNKFEGHVHPTGKENSIMIVDAEPIDG